MIGLYASKTKDLPPRKTLLEWVCIDVGEKKMRAWREMNEEHAKESIAGILLLQFGMEQQGIPLDGESVLYKQNGRPYLKSGTADFSISHTEGLVVCAIEQRLNMGNFGVGVDAERIKGRSDASMKRIAERWFSEREQELFWKAPQEANFLRIWTGKEAIAKRTGKGLSTLSNCDTTEPGEDIRLTAYEINDAVITLCHHVTANPPTNILWMN